MAPFPFFILSLAPEETSAEEGMTRPSRGQCDSVHVIPPAVPVSISFVTSHSVDGEPRADSPTPAVTAVTTGVGEPCSGMKVLSLPLPLPLAHTSSQALVHLLLPFLWPDHLASWTLEQCLPQPPCNGTGAYLCISSVLSFMSPLSNLLPDPLPGQPVTYSLQGPPLTSQGPAWGLSLWALLHILP